MDLTDTRYEVENGLAWITIDRPERMNAFRARTVDELIHLFTRAWASPEVGVICLTGAGDRAFCAGGDQKQRAETGDYGPSESGLFEIERLHRLIREVPKPVIAAVNGVAIGGGHVLHVLCDVTIAAEYAPRSARSGPRVGLVRRRASAPRTWRAWSGRSARGRSGSAAGATTPRPRSDGGWSIRSCRSTGSATRFASWADDMLALSPTALRFLKQSFNADTEHIAGIGQLVVQRARAVLRDRRVARGRAGVHREPRARLSRTLPRRRRRASRASQRSGRRPVEPARARGAPNRAAPGSAARDRRGATSSAASSPRAAGGSRPASRSTLKWCVHVDLVTGRSKLPHGR